MAFLDYSGLSHFLDKIKTIFISSSQKGAVNGIASLDASGKVPSSQLPSYVDDVIEVASYSNLPVTGESGKIYVTLDTNKTYRWSGSAYVEISNPGIMTGATSSAAGTAGLVPAPAAGDNVKILYGDGTWKNVNHDVLEYASEDSFPASGEAGKIYVALDTNIMYRWDTDEYVALSSGGSSEAVYQDLPLSIATTAWTQSSGVYTYTYTDPLITETSLLDIYFRIGAREVLVNSDVQLDKVISGNTVSAVITVTAVPLGTLPITLRVINASQVSILGVSAANVTTNAVAGSSNVEEALGALVTANSAKASKVSDATSGNFAALDSNGNLADSGHKHSDYLTSHQDISGKLDSTLKGAVNGLAELDANGKVPSSQLPSYVDDVVEYASSSNFPATGESGKIYVALDTNVTYRWGGSSYVVIGSSLALGETESTAYRGDRGKAAYEAAVTNVDATPTANSNNLVKSGGVYSAIDLKYTKPVSGIPATDIASGVIPTVPTNVSSFTNDAGYGTYTKPSDGIPRTDLASGVALPAVTSSDNGKVLMVSSGAWAAVTIPSASGVSF